MSNTMKRLVIASMVTSGLVAVAAIVDMVVGFPFSRRIVMDVLFLISAALILYMAYDTYQELA